MANAATRGPKYSPRRVKSADERGSRGQFITLKQTNEQFVGYALFKPDPELDDNPGYYEYFEHYTPATGFCPCAGENCPLCEEGDNPNTRAKAVFLVSKDGKDFDVDNCELKVFNLNWSVIQEFVDYLSDGDPVLGQLWRVKRLEGKGKYGIRLKDKKLTKANITAALKATDFPNLEGIATKQLNRVMEELDVEAAMEEKDDEDEPSKNGKATTARKGRAAKDDEPDEATAVFDPDGEDDAEDLEVTVVKVTKSKNLLKVTLDADEDVEFEVYGTDKIDVTELTKGDSIVISAEKDTDEDWVLSDLAAEAGKPAAEGEVPDDFEGVVTLKAVKDDIMTVVTEDDIEFDVFFLDAGEDDDGKDWAELDFEDFEEGQQVKIVAAKDADGDMLASAFPEAVKAKGRKGAAAK